MKSVIAIIFTMLLGIEASAAIHPTHSLGTGVAVDLQGRPWVIGIEPAENGSLLSMAVANDPSAPRIRVTSRPEPISADGENHPKLAFGPKGEIYVSWTSPTSDHFTGDIHFVRSLDDGKSWSAPSTVHKDRQLITHRFDSLAIDGQGRIWVVWIDKRDQAMAEKNHQDYAGAAIYYAYSEDQGAHWKGDFKLADHSCECCRIALVKDEHGRAVAFWRHVFAGNERDHALAVLEPNHKPAIHRVTFDHWRIDACPHHGPSLAIDARGIRHAVWFSQVDGESQAFYGQLHDDAPPTQILKLPRGATHPDIAVSGSTLAIAWKRFDGTRSMIETRVSADGGASFNDGASAQTTVDSDQPRLIAIRTGVLSVWRRADGLSTFAVNNGQSPIKQASVPSGSQESRHAAAVHAFELETLKSIVQANHGSAFWLVMWDLDCPYCMKSLANIAHAQQRDPSLRVITVSTDPIEQSEAIKIRLAQLGVRSEAYAFSSASADALRYAVDPDWAGEKPRAYFYDSNGARTAFTGVLTEAQLTR